MCALQSVRFDGCQGVNCEAALIDWPQGAVEGGVIQKRRQQIEIKEERKGNVSEMR